MDFLFFFQVQDFIYDDLDILSSVCTFLNARFLKPHKRSLNNRYIYVCIKLLICSVVSFFVFQIMYFVAALHFHGYQTGSGHLEMTSKEEEQPWDSEGICVVVLARQLLSETFLSVDL